MSTKATSSSTTTAATTTTTTSTPPLPTPPFIPIPGLPNFRDAGGYPLAADPARKMVRRGVLFRSSEPSMLTPAGVAALRDGLGVRTVYDLRSRVEIDRDAGAAGGGGRRVREWDGSERVFAPVFSHEDYSPEAIARRFSAFAREGSEVSGSFFFFFFFLPLFSFPAYFLHERCMVDLCRKWTREGGAGPKVWFRSETVCEVDFEF